VTLPRRTRCRRKPGGVEGVGDSKDVAPAEQPGECRYHGRPTMPTRVLCTRNASRSFKDWGIDRSAWSLNSQGDVARDRETHRRTRIIRQGLAIFRNFGDRWGIAGTLGGSGQHGEGRAGFSAAHSLYRESLKISGKLETQARNCPPAWECSRVRRQLNTISAASSCGWLEPAAALRKNIWRSADACGKSQARGQSEMHTAGLSETSSTAAWLEGGNCGRASDERRFCAKPGALPAT